MTSMTALSGIINDSQACRRKIHKAFCLAKAGALVLFTACALLAGPSPAGAAATAPADGAGAYATGRYRNLFAELGYSQAEIRKKIETAFNQLFYGDPNTQRVYYEAGTNANGPLAYMLDVKHQAVRRTEGL
ncbi:MAG: hypothetical protein RMH97_09930, partial [Verrucomicrobiales bacterium]|nr:hypothetical protein [Verrucomicrobiales bacterium]